MMYCLTPEIIMVTAEEIKQRFEALSKQPRDPNITFTCACGKHAPEVQLTDKDYQEIADILNGES